MTSPLRLQIVGRKNHGKTTLVLELIALLRAGCDLILVEGHLDGPGPKVEVWRAAGGTAPLCRERDDIHAVISDDDPDVPVPVWPRGDLPALLRHLTEAGLVPA
jgi:molybdopterin-guanine dinucleotide biosynthesis protein